MDRTRNIKESVLNELIRINRQEAQKELLKEFKEDFKFIISKDKTPYYEYSSMSKKYLDNDGNAPEVGSRWTTPREYAFITLQQINKKLEEMSLDTNKENEK